MYTQQKNQQSENQTGKYYWAVCCFCLDEDRQAQNLRSQASVGTVVQTPF